ncbi:MAG: (deoxy)nucleoside triphosphate pyrophosphohydrolase [Fusobacterium sp.]|uniref:(deoxy)nucleoside triphosphate pyrophosphohydrolase n=1 Tax=Fusobacterium sp. TaxID=68766 RepID=UPI003999DDA9
MKKVIKVVGGIIVDKDNRILCTLRKKEKSLGNMWEFPGGKIEVNETDREALEREIKEEMDLKIEVISFYEKVKKEYEEFIIYLKCYKCKIVDNGKYILKDHSAAIWLSKENLDSLVWVPTDYPIVRKLINDGD